MKKMLVHFGIFLLAGLIGSFSVFLAKPKVREVNEKELLIKLENMSEQVAVDESVTQEEIAELTPSPDGVYFPINSKLEKAELALIFTFFDDLASGSVKVGKEFIESDLTLDNGRVKMVSQKSGRTHYEFQGKFLKDGFADFFETNETVLTGTLTKYIDSKKVYSIRSEYTFAAEVCAWNPNNQEF